MHDYCLRCLKRLGSHTSTVSYNESILSIIASLIIWNLNLKKRASNSSCWICCPTIYSLKYMPDEPKQGSWHYFSNAIQSVLYSTSRQRDLVWKGTCRSFILQALAQIAKKFFRETVNTRVGGSYTIEAVRHNFMGLPDFSANLLWVYIVFKSGCLMSLCYNVCSQSFRDPPQCMLLAPSVRVPHELKCQWTNDSP